MKGYKGGGQVVASGGGARHPSPGAWRPPTPRQGGLRRELNASPPLGRPARYPAACRRKEDSVKRGTVRPRRRSRLCELRGLQAGRLGIILR